MGVPAGERESAQSMWAHGYGGAATMNPSNTVHGAAFGEQKHVECSYNTAMMMRDGRQHLDCATPAPSYTRVTPWQ